MAGRSAPAKLALYLFQPTLLQLELVDDQAQHPDSFMVRMSNFAQDCPQSGLLAFQF
jgi:hypothetical protein